MIREESIQLEFRYAAGRVRDRFVAALTEGRILGARCPSCERVCCPARSICPACAARTEELLDVGPSGELLAFTTRSTRDDLPPERFALVRLDESDSDMLHKLVRGPAPPAVGARVRAVFDEGSLQGFAVVA